MTPADRLAALRARDGHTDCDCERCALLAVAEAAIALNLPDEPGGWQPEFGAKAALRAALARLGATP